jgi:hypothetical protein
VHFIWLHSAPPTVQHASTSTSPSPPFFSRDHLRALCFNRVNCQENGLLTDPLALRPQLLRNPRPNLRPNNTLPTAYTLLLSLFLSPTNHPLSRLQTEQNTLKMSQVTLHPSPVKDGRRILSEKSANACLSPASQRYASPVKRVFVDSTSPQKLLPSPTFTAQKRSIGQLDGEDSDSRGSLRVPRVDSQMVAPLQRGELDMAPSTEDRDVRVSCPLRLFD